ncbi:MAG: glycosyltransferase family 2 protein [Byssovorax sp.]
MIITVLDLLLLVVGLVILIPAAYLFVLSILGSLSARRLPPSIEAEPRLRFTVVVPAHDEEQGIATTVESLRAIDYPPSLFQILVVADNCTDRTAERAEQAGARVLVRDEPERRGKGYALALAFAAIDGEGWADAVTVIDADTTVSPNLLRAFALRFEGGALAAQASYGVQNPQSSWRTRLMVIALSLFHRLRSLGRERLGLSAGLRGNGMGLTREALRRVPYRAYSLTEDVEHGISLGEEGIRVAFVPEAEVWGEMVSGARGSRSQRLRWEEGRASLARSRGPRLVLEGLRRRDAMLLDLGLDLIVPPLTSLALASLLGAAAALGLAGLGGPLFPAIPWLTAALMLALYVLAGWRGSGVGLRGLVDLAVYAPVYMAWKIVLALRQERRPAGEWVRTTREARHDH